MTGTDKVRARLSLISRMIMALCVLPATFTFYGSLFEWSRAIGKGKGYFVSVFNRPNIVYARLSSAPRIFAVPILAPLSAALQIRRFGGVLPCMSTCIDVVRREGMGGIGKRVKRLMPVRRKMKKNLVPARNRILVMDYRIPMADISAGERATVGILRDMCALGFDVVFLPGDMRPSPGYAAKLRRFGVTVVTGEDGYDSATDYLTECGSSFSAFYLIRIEIVLAVLDTIRIIAPGARVIFHAPDLYHLREMREAQLKDNEILYARAQQTKQRELDVIQRVDHTVLISHAELNILRKELPDAPFSVFHGLYASILSKIPSFGDRKDIFFLGGFSHTPNVDAVCWFTEAIWPLIRMKLPDVTFHIVGSEAPPAVLELARRPGVNIVGFMNDLSPLFSSMRLGVAPLRYGAGIKGKVAMTLGAGIPCICTTIAAEGMHLDGGMRTCIGNEPAEFAEHVIRLYSNQQEWERVSGAGREIVMRHFSEQANRTAFANVLAEARIVLSKKSGRVAWRAPMDI